MAPIAGTYQHVKNEKLTEYLVALGSPEDKAKLADSLQPKLEVKVDGKNVSLNSYSDVENVFVTFVIGEEIDEKMPNNVVVKSLAKLDGDSLTIQSKTPNGQTATRVYKFSESDLVVTLSTDGHSVVAKRFYKKL